MKKRERKKKRNENIKEVFWLEGVEQQEKV